jgi:hypothetical protein
LEKNEEGSLVKRPYFEELNVQGNLNGPERLYDLFLWHHR